MPNQKSNGLDHFSSKPGLRVIDGVVIDQDSLTFFESQNPSSKAQYGPRLLQDTDAKPIEGRKNSAYTGAI